MRSGFTNSEEYPAKGRFKQSLIAGLKSGETDTKTKGGTFKAKKIEFFGLKIDEKTITSSEESKSIS